MVEYKRAPANVINLREVALDRVFSALSDTTRRRLVRTLAEREYSVSELAEPFDMSLAAVSKHLSVLEQAGLVRRRKDGRTRYCSLRPEALAGVLDWIAVYRQFWRQRFDALANDLAGPAQRSRKR
jgi:DNA-binding transcriptional ArsR family regulator